MLLPYNYTLEKDGYFFESSSGLTYKVWFTKSADNYGLHPNYSIASISFSYVKGINQEKSNSPRVSLTIVKICQDLFEKRPDYVLTYICENKDERGLARNRLFKGWINNYGKDLGMSYVGAEIGSDFQGGFIFQKNEKLRTSIETLLNLKGWILSDESEKHYSFDSIECI